MTANPEEQFDRVARAYVTSAVHAQGADLVWLVEALRPEPTWQVVDLGTGAGHAALAVAPHVASVRAMDVSARMLEEAGNLAAQRRCANLSFTQASVDALPLPDAACDAAISRYSAHHWPRLDGALAEAARVLRRGAPLVVIDTVSPEAPALDTFLNALELLRDPSHGRNARLSEWTALLERSGFAVQAPRSWQIDLRTEEWLARAASADWRGEACGRLLREASRAAQEAFAITDDASGFSLPCALLLARRR
jgi:ubiquinone/menaquinone biosynthesis C-methylase UbiE